MHLLASDRRNAPDLEVCACTGFVGVDEFNWYTSGALLALNTFGYPALITCAQHVRKLRAERSIPQTCLSYLLVATLKTCVATCSAAIQRRHLMVWALFAPRLLFEICFLSVVDMCLSMLVMLLPPERS